MTKTQRLFQLLQILRRHKTPVTASNLSQELGVSARTLYRDIFSLQEQGAQIEGERGLGYILRPGFMLPPLMFSEEEIESIVLGARWVAKNADSVLQSAAQHALAKIAAVLPKALREQLDESGLLVPPGTLTETKDLDLVVLRQAMRYEKKLQFVYQDIKDQTSTRTVWPLGLGFFDHVRILIAWCELRQDFRHFRVDRMADLTMLNLHYPKRRQTLLRQWRKLNGIPPQ